MRKNKIIYAINVEDIQTVAVEVLDRELSTKEIEKIIDPIAEKISWYDAIADSINDNLEVRMNNNNGI